jgi:hypothetical protein
LLAGLLDTDGGCTAHGTVEFYSSREVLARDVLHLAATLGYKPTLRSKTARLRGKDCGLTWTVTFTAADKVFRLPRKASRQVTQERATSAYRYITAIRPVPSVPVRCIAVDSPNHLYLVGESCIPTHNSNLLNVLLAQLVRCVDVLIFCIDMKYRLVMPWAMPYLEDEGHGRAVDWAATDRHEAEVMLRAFVRGIEARAAAGAGEEKIQPSPHQPAVFLVIDEIASIFGIGTGPRSSMEGTTNTTLAGIGTDAVRLGRSEAMDLIAASQRGTVTMLGSGDFKSQFPLRIGLRVQNEAEAQAVIPDDPHAAKILASLRHEGTGLVQWNEGRLMRVKFFRITPQQVSEVARRYGPMKPDPEQVLVDAFGEEYVTRWDRFRATRKAAVPPGRPGAQPPVPRQFDPRAARPTAGRDAMPRKAEPRSAGAGSAGPGPPLPATRRRIQGYIGRSGKRGVTLRMILNLLDTEHLYVDEHTIRRWLNDDIHRGLLERTPRGIYRVRQPAAREPAREPAGEHGTAGA